MKFLVSRLFLLASVLGLAGLIGTLSWVQSIYFNMIPAKEFGEKMFLLLSYILNLFPSLLALVYAVSIYVLYRHLSQLVVFESEVV